MKKILFFLLAFMPVMLFTACSDDDNETPVDSRLEGTWLAQEGGEKAEFTFYGNGNVYSRATDTQGNQQDLKGTYTAKDGQLTFKWKKAREKGVNEIQWEDWEDIDETKHTTYSISGNGKDLRMDYNDSESGFQTFVAHRTNGEIQ